MSTDAKRVSEVNLDEAAPAHKAFFPMSPHEAAAVQQAASKRYGIPVDWTDAFGIKFRLIPPGWFLMGSPPDKPGANADEHPIHRVRISEAFYMGVHPVTRGQYRRVTGDSPSVSAPIRGGPRYPVDSVTWAQCVRFCVRLSQSHRKRFRLPTEAEWEYACRAGSPSSYCFGGNRKSLKKYARFIRSLDLPEYPTSKTGTRMPNAWGLYDVHGNVSEWCSDRYDKDYYSSSPAANPRGPETGESRVIRGGGGLDTASACRSAFRGSLKENVRVNDVGVRVVAMIT